MDVEANIHQYLYGDSQTLGVKPFERYASFDYCFNYFQSFRERGSLKALADAEHLQTSCLQLGYYLASWGMLRGSGFLLSKSVKVYEPLIRAIAGADPTLWEIDANCYTSLNIRLLFVCRRMIAAAFGQEGDPSDILVTKIMLGVFGSVPAFDSNFMRGFGVSVFGRKALGKVAHFYETHKATIDKYRVPTLDFATGQPTNRLYTRAKVIDMVFFIEGVKRG